MSRLEELIESLFSEENVQDRARLEPVLDEMRRYGPQFWIHAFSRCTARINKYLFLNAPELWTVLTAGDWLSIMASVTERSYRPSDIFDTGRFDDVKLLHKYVGVDSFHMFFLRAKTSRDGKDWLARHSLAVPELYVPDDWDRELFDETEVHVTADVLSAYQQTLLADLPQLKTATYDPDALRSRIKGYVEAAAAPA
jgi:hypothetical protein